MKKITICITGGHLTPALALIEEIQKQRIVWDMFFLGRGAPSQEERLVGALGVPFFVLSTGKFQRSISPLLTFASLLRVPIGFFQAFKYLLRYHPAIVVSFGGYIALPVVLAAWILRVPVITHEQTQILGLANSIIARIARRVFLGADIGVPIRLALFHPPTRPSFMIDESLPLIYITGGSAGAVTLNALIFPNIEALTRKYLIIHQVGLSSLAAAMRLKNRLPKEILSRYIVLSYIDILDVAWIYQHAILLIGRAGANTAAEVAALGLPALFVPLPWAAGNEQSLNAVRLEQLGMAMVLDQHGLTPASFMTTLERMMRNIDLYRSVAGNVARQYPRDAAGKIVQEMAKIIDR